MSTSLVLAGLTGWLLAVLLAGRAVPWEASRWWVLVFAVSFALATLWWLRFFRQLQAAPLTLSRRVALELVGAGLPAVVTVVELASVYLSDQFNALLARPYWAMPFLALLVLAMMVSEEARATALEEEKGLGTSDLASTVLRGVSSRSGDVLLVCLIVLGLLQAAARVIPIGDDIWHYSEVADALREGRPYPVTPAWTEILRAGSGSYYPALPLLPLLLAGSFSLFGRDLVGIAMPTVLATALFPLALYFACRAITGSRTAAYIATLLLYLFPIYQIHILGSPEPDTVFVTLMLTGAAFAAAANSRGSWLSWLGMATAMALASLTRHEGLPFAAVLFATFLLVHWRKLRYWAAVAAYFALLAPFALVYRSITGELWPSTFGTSVVRLQNFQDNLSNLGWASLPWYAQAVGVSEEAVVALFLGLGLASASGVVLLARRSPALAGIPLAGIGFTVGGFGIHPNLVYSAFPVEFLRHLSFGLPYACLGVAVVGLAAFRWVSARTRALRSLLLVATLVLVVGLLYYETDRLAKPEFYFDGPASLLWTGDSFLLTDVLRHPVPLPDRNDPRGGEQIRNDMTLPLDEVGLKSVNLSEPYYWTSLAVALLGLVYALAPAAAALSVPSRRGRLCDDGDVLSPTTLTRGGA